MTMSTRTSPDKAASDSSSASTNTTATSSVAGTTNYGKWHSATSSLLTELEASDAAEKERSDQLLGLDGRIPRSEAEADERRKAETARATKSKLDSHKEREEGSILTLEDVFAEKGVEGGEVEITRADFEGANDGVDGSHQKRVLCLRNSTGPCTVVLTSDLSKLSTASTVPDRDEKPQRVQISGLVKLFLSNLENCTVVTRCKIITSTIEISHCRNVRVVMEGVEGKVCTVQADLCEGLTLEYVGYDPQRDGLLFGGGKEDRIYHAGVKDLKVVVRRKSGEGERMEAISDYIRDGAVAVGTATAEEYQFVTYVNKSNELVTERLIRMGNGKALTQSEFDLEEETKKAGSKDTTDKGSQDCSDVDVDEEIFVDGTKTLTQTQRDDLLQTCERHRLEGNEAFSAGEYAQAVLLYSLAVDKSTPLGDCFEKKHVCYANRSAAFLKLGHHDKALEDAVRCTELDPSYIKGVFRRGLALHALKRYGEARPWLVKALEMEPKNKQVKQALTFCEVQLQKEARKRMGDD